MPKNGLKLTNSDFAPDSCHEFNLSARSVLSVLTSVLKDEEFLLGWPAFSCFLLLTFYLFWWGIDVKIFTKFKFNHAFILEMDAATAVDHRRIWFLSTAMAVC